MSGRTRERSAHALFGLPATGAITFWVPIVIFAFLFGLAIDYEVFILARMREAYDQTGDTSTAVIEGIGRTGRLVTSAALILTLAFLAMSTAPLSFLKMLATGLAAGIPIDAFIIRALLVPARVAIRPLELAAPHPGGAAVARRRANPTALSRTRLPGTSDRTQHARSSRAKPVAPMP